jgi:hypothetical protein
VAPLMLMWWAMTAVHFLGRSWQLFWFTLSLPHKLVPMGQLVSDAEYLCAHALVARCDGKDSLAIHTCLVGRGHLVSRDALPGVLEGFPFENSQLSRLCSL